MPSTMNFAHISAHISALTISILKDLKLCKKEYSLFAAHFDISIRAHALYMGSCGLEVSHPLANLFTHIYPSRMYQKTPT